MNLTRRISSLLADPRRGFAGVLTVMFLVLTVLGVQVLCSVHLDEAGHSDVEQPAMVAAVGAPDRVAEVAPGHHDGEDPFDCSEDRTLTARYDRTLSPSTDLAEAPGLALQWLVPDTAHHVLRVPSGVAAAAAPSLHALGISRT
ncbi:hypothetical protein AB1046_13660 [Promicromonospora sp. Populi]|uniref:hypothetical protein n=1 Tax=Promicromonospora sp. Populi TaxID=3239420 RepID=UPI0034E2D05A